MNNVQTGEPRAACSARTFTTASARVDTANRREAHEVLTPRIDTGQPFVICSSPNQVAAQKVQSLEVGPISTPLSRPYSSISSTDIDKTLTNRNSDAEETEQLLRSTDDGSAGHSRLIPVGACTPHPPPTIGSSPTTVASHKEKRKIKQISLSRQFSSAHPSASNHVPIGGNSCVREQIRYGVLLHSALHPATMSRPVSLLVASLGNPPPYHFTRHSAAHVVLRSLQVQLSLPPFIPKAKPWASGSISYRADVDHPDFTLWRSPSQMNVSGLSVLKAWKQFLTVTGASRNGSDITTGLVIVHDEMEINPGAFKVRRGGNSSVKGHNGLKSVQASLSGAALLDTLGDRFIKIGVGIGRPPSGSRESRDVSAFVLGQITTKEKEGLEGAAAGIVGVLRAELSRLGGGGSTTEF